MKKEDGDKLVKGFRERLKDYSEPVPDNLWSSLEKELDKFPVVHSHPLRRLIIAASLLIIAITSVSVWFLKAPVEKYVPEVALTSVSSEGQKRQVDEESQQVLPPLANSQPSEVIAFIGRKEREKELKVKDEEFTENDQFVGDTARVERNNSAREVSERKEKPKTRKKETVKDHQYKKRQEKNVHALASLNRKDYKKWTVGISYGSSSAIKNSGMPGFSSLDIKGNLAAMNMLPTYAEGNCSDEDFQKIKPFKKILANNIGKDPETSVKHKTPVTAGISFRYNLSRNFAVETGLTYTMLSSELKSGSENDFYVEEYKLHYLGIPLKGNWMFLNRRYFTLYLSAGGAIEKSVAGDYKVTYVTSGKPEEHRNENVKPVQWSVSAAVGAQFNATEHFGIYVEPGVVHYFDDGSNVETIRKEKPTNFNLQLGLRWTY